MAKKPKAKTNKPTRRIKTIYVEIVVPLHAPPGITHPRQLQVITGQKATGRAFPGGKRNKGEKPQQAGGREVGEETGMIVTFLKIRPLRDKSQNSDGDWVIRTFRIARVEPSSGPLRDCAEIWDNRYDSIGFLLDNLSLMKPLHGEMLAKLAGKFDAKSSLSRALKQLQRGPMRSRR